MTALALALLEIAVLYWVARLFLSIGRKVGYQLGKRDGWRECSAFAESRRAVLEAIADPDGSS